MTEDGRRRTHIDLFSGIGGFALAARWAGFHTQVFCEREPYAQRVLRKNFPGVPIVDDIADFYGRDYLGTTLLSGGFPCQPYSQAGQRRGSEDDRAIWSEMARVISEARPAWVLGENVVGLVSMGLDEVLSDMEGMGYSTQTFIIPACAVGAPHRRDRVFFLSNVSDSEGLGHGRGDREERRTGEGKLLEEEQEGSPVGSEAQGCGELHGGEEALADSDLEGLEGHDDRTTSSEPRGSGEANLGAEDLSLGGNYWKVVPEVRRVDDGFPNRVDRLRGLGNAIVPQVAFEIIRLIP